LKKKAREQANRRPSKALIHYTMSRVRSSGSQLEAALGRALWRAGLRYRKQYPIFGTPDFALVNQRIAIFCDSEFWHGYRWGQRRKSEHKSNRSYWFAKIERNRARDRRVNRQLTNDGWIVIRLWEREILRNANACASEIAALLYRRSKKSSPRVESSRSQRFKLPPRLSGRVMLDRDGT
jgi:DNA mismatch endonuclease, patch repair protein